MLLCDQILRHRALGLLRYHVTLLQLHLGLSVVCLSPSAVGCQKHACSRSGGVKDSTANLSTLDTFVLVPADALNGHLWQVRGWVPGCTLPELPVLCNGDQAKQTPCTGHDTSRYPQPILGFTCVPPETPHTGCTPAAVATAAVDSSTATAPAYTC